ncbi:MAG: hypothetical protein EBX41_09050, partial [Chitinophagia bacterium]|nr:hypothetical protein [Chitinophagia bacterium]
MFPANNPWHLDVSTAKVDTFSTQNINQFATASLHPDFGAGQWNGAPMGIPYAVVCAKQPAINVVYRGNSYDGNYGAESDPGPFPIPLNAPIESNGNGDSHVIAVDMDGKYLYELYNAQVVGDHWEASCGAKFDLKSNYFRTDGYTSADAAGLPIYPGLIRY